MNDTASNTLRAWKVLSRQPLLERTPWFELYQEQVELPSGRVLSDFYRIVLPRFAVVVPVTPDGKVIMVRGYKHGLGRVTLSPPAGLLQPDEEPLAAAQRELLEETGYQADDWRELGTFVVDGNRQCGTLHAFIARDVTLAGTPQEDDTEQLQVGLLSRDELLTALRQGEVGTLAAAGTLSLALALGL